MAKNHPNDQFGILARDGVGNVMSSWASAFTCQDASATPKTSPLAYTFAVYALVPPDNAVRLTLLPTTDMRVVTEDPTTVRYFFAKALTEATFQRGLDAGRIRRAGHQHHRHTAIPVRDSVTTNPGDTRPTA